MGVLLTSKSPGQGYDLQPVFRYREEYFKIGEIAFYIDTSTRDLRGSHSNAMLMPLPLLSCGGCSRQRWDARTVQTGGRPKAIMFMPLDLSFLGHGGRSCQWWEARTV